MVLEKTLESPLDCKEIQPVILKEINPEYSLEGLIFEAETPILWPLDANMVLFMTLTHVLTRADTGTQSKGDTMN